MPAKDSDDSTDQLIKQIDSYLHDKHHRYAIALEGAWGSGKTRFLEKKVAPHLKNENIDLVRVSMFGVSSADDLYERIAMALVHLSDRSKRMQSAIGTDRPSEGQSKHLDSVRNSIATDIAACRDFRRRNNASKRL